MSLSPDEQTEIIVKRQVATAPPDARERGIWALIGGVRQRYPGYVVSDDPGDGDAVHGAAGSDHDSLHESAERAD